MLDVKVTKLSFFTEVQEKILEQANIGTKSMAEAVAEDAKGSMAEGGAPGAADYKVAPPGKPPYRHKSKLWGSIDIAEDGKGRWYAGTRFSEVGLRGVYLEFGGRELKPGEKGKPRKRKLLPHPFMGPALDRQIDTFAPRVAGTFTG